MNTPTPGFRDLVDLLYGVGATAPEMHLVYKSAIETIYCLRNALRISQNALDGARLDAQSWKTLADNLREANARLVESETQLKGELERQASTISRLTRERNLETMAKQMAQNATEMGK
jgi:hypothetical protein